MAPVTVDKMVWLPQLPIGNSLSHVNVKRRQMKQPARILAMVEVTIMGMVA